MKVAQCSDWSSEPLENLQRQYSTSSESTEPKSNAWTEDKNEKRQTNRTKISAPGALLYGFLIGSFLMGIALAVVSTVWVTSTRSKTTIVIPTSTITTSIPKTVTTQSTTSTTSTSSTTLTTSTSSTTSTTSTSSTTSTTSTSSTTSTTSTSSTTSTASTSSTTSTTTTTTTTTMIPPNLLVNPDAENGTLTPWIIGGSGTPAIDDGTANSGMNPHSGAKQFYGGAISTGSTSTLMQSILLLNGTQGYTEAQLDSGILHAYISFYEQSYYQILGSDKAQISLAFRTLNNTLLSTYTTALFSCTSGWCAQSSSYVLPVGTRRIDYIMIFQLQTGSDIDSYFDDNSLKVY